MLEEELPEIRQLGETDLAGGHALRIERGVHLAQEGAGRRGFPQAQLVTALVAMRCASRAASRLSGRRSRERWDSRRATWRPRSRVEPPQAAIESAQRQQRRRASRA